MTTPSPELIEHARKVKDVAEDWGYALCANRCGEIAFYPPDVPNTVLIFCSNECVTEFLQTVQP